MNNEEKGILFSEEYQKSLKAQFCYADQIQNMGSGSFLKIPAVH